MAQPTIPVTALFSPDLEAQTKRIAINQGVSRGEIIRLAVVEYLKRLETQTTKPQPEMSNAKI
jgi:hypothetical protein